LAGRFEYTYSIAEVHGIYSPEKYFLPPCFLPTKVEFSIYQKVILE